MGFLRSTDGFDHWTAVKGGLGARFVEAFAAGGSGSGTVLYAGTWGGSVFDRESA